MSNETLRKHYQVKYTEISDAPAIDLIKDVKIPLNRFEAVVKAFPDHFKGGDILEIGAGNGNVAKKLLESNLSIDSYTLGDLSLPRMEGVRKNLADKRLKVLEMDAENMSESDYGKYDAILMVALIEHLIDPMGAMQRIHKLLKPGGFVYIDTPNIAKYTRRITLMLGRFPSTASTDEGLTTFYGEPVDLHEEGHLHYFTYRSLSRMLTERCDFSKVVKIGYPGGKIPLGKHVHYCLSQVWPEMFSELAIFAYA